MNDVIIRARDLVKIYRLYGNPQYRVLDMFGLLPNNGKRFKEHTALAGISLEIGRGEKVAVIGRNGAGKSTLLKLISNVIQPTSGVLEVRGDARALLQIGSGFHPDFTGRENVYAYLAYMGIYGKAADRKLDEVVEFSELEEYIDQPLKTYSSGMALRLMFSTSTAIAPDILVLDEVLSVGDAYFSQKSFDRITELSERNGTTLLLVSHEIYSAAKLCPRLIWLDRGQILVDGDGPTVLRAYEDSIREQEEQRLRKKKQNRLKQLSEITEGQPLYLVIEIRSRNNAAQDGPIYFSSIRLLRSGTVVAALPLDVDDFDETGSHLQLEATNWGKVRQWQGRLSRPMLNFGTSFHKVSGVFRIDDPGSIEQDELELKVEYWAAAPPAVSLRVIRDDDQFELGDLPSDTGVWHEHRVRFSLRRTQPVARDALLKDVSMSGVHGSGRIRIEDVVVMNERGEETYAVSHGDPVSIGIHYSVRDPEFDGRAQVLVSFKKDGIHDVCRFIARDLIFRSSQQKGIIRLSIPKLGLSNGRYAVTVMI